MSDLDFDGDIEDTLKSVINGDLSTYQNKDNSDWANKITTTLEGKPILMVHRFREEFLDLKLDDYVLVFDDGLYNHYLWYKKILNKFPRIHLIFAVSTNIIANSYDIQDDMESPEAHELYFKYDSKIGFLNIKQIIEISSTRNCFIAVHGHNHLNLDTTRQKLGLMNFYQAIQKEYMGMFETAMTWIYQGIIKSKLIVVLPYNQYNILAIAQMRHIRSKYDPAAGLVLMGPGRIDIETLKGI